MKEEEKRLKKENKDLQAKIKVHKDFGFLLKLTPIIINARTAKYVLQEGEG